MPAASALSGKTSPLAFTECDLLGASPPLDPCGEFRVPVGEPTRQPQSQGCGLDLGAIPSNGADDRLADLLG